MASCSHFSLAATSYFAHHESCIDEQSLVAATMLHEALQRHSCSLLKPNRSMRPLNAKHDEVSLRHLDALWFPQSLPKTDLQFRFLRG
mmetsp:Transcript_21463/g.59719  ORF Transcript_21463/g.59719 Transcript_21463/m.59719 type:complete len:88 (-) Transcript_21463:1169-1432(-)